MFCPKCAANNLDNAAFCRGCGANIKLVPHALTGQLPTLERGSEESPSGRKGQPTLDNSLKNIFMGIAFLIIAIALSRTGMGGSWWFWMLIPAFSLLGTGIAQYIRLKEAEKKQVLNSAPHQSIPSSLPASQAPPSFPPSNQNELAPPPSVTEGTTRHLGADAPTRHLDANK